MYENGKRVNGYHRKRTHKRKQKESYAKRYDGNGCSWNILRAKYENEEPTKWGHPLDYWNDYDLTGPREFAKEQTSSKLRQQGRQIEYQALREDFDAILNDNLKGAEYQKFFDYAWTIW